jgi:uncharacterized protein YukE
MARISIDPEEARNAATAATTAAGDAEANLSTLTQNVSVLDSMEGDWRTRGWDELFADYKKQADALLPTLEAMTEFLNQAAQSFEELSAGFAGG